MIVIDDKGTRNWVFKCPIPEINPTNRLEESRTRIFFLFCQIFAIVDDSSKFHKVFYILCKIIKYGKNEVYLGIH